MKTLTLDQNLLHVLHLVQTRKQMALKESLLGLIDDWEAVTREYFFKLPENLVSGIGLAKNEYCFQAIIAFVISNEINNTCYSRLDQFIFSY